MSDGTILTSTFIQLVKSIRESKGLTIEHLADLAGVHRTTIGLLERHERTPTLQVAHQIATALGFPLSNLIQRAESSGVHDGAGATYAKMSAAARTADPAGVRNEGQLISLTGLNGSQLLRAIDSCYETLDQIDSQLRRNGLPPIAELVELANLSSMVGNIVGAGLADASNGLYLRNKPHTYPDLVPQRDPAVSLELKMALETNRPKGHLPKPGTYITFRYVLGDSAGNYVRGKDKRGDTVWLWEVKVGELKENDFSCSNTEGDSGKTAVIRTGVHNDMPTVYYAENFLPYAPRRDGRYVGYN